MKKAIRILAWFALCTATAIFAPLPAQSQDMVEELSQVERERLRSLVDGDMDLARKLHADEFQLIIPAGLVWSKDQYLGGIEAGTFRYRSWEPEGEIKVKYYGDAAVIRYPARLEIVVRGEVTSLRAWHTDVYERRGNDWQVVWSQATERPSSQEE